MEIRVAGYTAASLLLEREPQQWHALVILDSDLKHSTFIEAHSLSHLYLTFDDIEEPRGGKRPPTAPLVERGLEFSRCKDKLLVCCRAGRGRSVAMAYLICCRQRGVGDAIRLLDPTRHRPNRLVVMLGDALSDCPDVLAAFDKWRYQNAGIRLSDYYDQMEQEFEALEAQGAVDRISESQSQ